MIAVGLILALAGCASYETAQRPNIEQFAKAECREKDTDECKRLRVKMQAVYDQYHNSGGKGAPFNFVYILNQPPTP